jgi:hypothetical protein
MAAVLRVLFCSRNLWRWDGLHLAERVVYIALRLWHCILSCSLALPLAFRRYRGLTSLVERLLFHGTLSLAAGPEPRLGVCINGPNTPSTPLLLESIALLLQHFVSRQQIYCSCTHWRSRLFLYDAPSVNGLRSETWHISGAKAI